MGATGDRSSVISDELISVVLATTTVKTDHRAGSFIVSGRKQLFEEPGCLSYTSSSTEVVGSLKEGVEGLSGVSSDRSLVASREVLVEESNNVIKASDSILDLKYWKFYDYAIGKR